MNNYEYKTANELFETISRDLTIDSRLKKSIVNIKNACDQLAEEVQSKRGIVYTKNPINITTVGKKCDELFGGPSAKSILANAKKEPLKSLYIRLRATELTFPTNVENKIDPIDSIEDKNIRAYIKNLERQLEYKTTINKQLTKYIKNIEPSTILDIVNRFSVNGNSSELVMLGSQKNKLSKELIHTLFKILDENHLKKFHLKFSSGYIVDETTEEEFLSKTDINIIKNSLET